MKLSLVAALAILLGSVAAAPNGNSTLEVRKVINDCGPSTFIDQTSSGSPSVADCQALFNRFKGGGTYILGCGGEHKKLNSKNGCAFGAQSEDKTADICYVGNSDAMLAIQNAIDKFAKNGKIGAAGFFTCESSNSGTRDHRIKWNIYHN